MRNFKSVLLKPLTIGIALIILVAITTIGLNPASSAPTTSNGQLLWYGQSAFKLTTPSGKVLLIDPWLTNPGNSNGKTDLAKLDHADLILITHGHFDHVGNAVEIAKKTQAKLVSTADLGQALVRYSGYPKELVPMDTQGNFGGELNLLNNEVKITFVSALHSSTIDSTGSPANYAGNPGGFIISLKNGPAIYHTGDTDLFVEMALIPQLTKVNVMLTCIGDKYTMGPKRAAIATSLVKPTIVVPMHYGIFNLPGTPAAFAQELQQAGVKSQLKVMKVGESMNL